MSGVCEEGGADGGELEETSERYLKEAAQHNRGQLSPWHLTIAGGVAGAIGATVTCPLEVLKTRLQSRTAEPTISSQSGAGSTAGAAGGGGGKVRLGTASWRALRQIVATEGVAALWRGLSPTLVGVVPSRATYFGVYTSTKPWLTPKDGRETPLTHFGSAAFAGMVATTLTNPLWMIKTRLQLERGRSSSGSVATALNIVRREGVLHLWKGLSASYLGIFETGIQWVLYEKMKQVYCHEMGLSQQEIHPALLFAFGSASKLAASFSWYPHEVARTRLREANAPYKGLFDCFAKIIQQEGPLRLYSGLSVHLLRVVPNSAITFVAFELLVRFLNQSNQAQQ